jgi:hypothetical protein
MRTQHDAICEQPGEAEPRREAVTHAALTRDDFTDALARERSTLRAGTRSRLLSCSRTLRSRRTVADRQLMIKQQQVRLTKATTPATF